MADEPAICGSRNAGDDAENEEDAREEFDRTITNKLHELDSRLSSLERSIHAENEEPRTSGIFNNLNGSLDALVQTAEAENERISSTIADRVDDAIQSTTRHLQERIDVLEKEITARSEGSKTSVAAVEQLQTDLQDAHRDIRKTSGEVSTHVTRLDNLEESLKEATSAKASSQRSLNKLGLDLDSIRQAQDQEHRDQRRDIEELRTKLCELKQTQDQPLPICDTDGRELDAQKKKLPSENQAGTALQSQLSDTRSDAERAQHLQHQSHIDMAAMPDELRRELGDFRSTIDRVAAGLEDEVRKSAELSKTVEEEITVRGRMQSETQHLRSQIESLLTISSRLDDVERLVKSESSSRARAEAAQREEETRRRQVEEQLMLKSDQHTRDLIAANTAFVAMQEQLSSTRAQMDALEAELRSMATRGRHADHADRARPASPYPNVNVPITINNATPEPRRQGDRSTAPGVPMHGTNTCEHPACGRYASGSSVFCDVHRWVRCAGHAEQSTRNCETTRQRRLGETDPWFCPHDH